MGDRHKSSEIKRIAVRAVPSRFHLDGAGTRRELSAGRKQAGSNVRHTGHPVRILAFQIGEAGLRRLDNRRRNQLIGCMHADNELTDLIRDKAGIRWRVSRKVLITFRDWVSKPSFSRDRAEPHPPCPRIRLSHSVFQPSTVRKWSPPLTVAA
jgi:hypothetical protein